MHVHSAGVTFMIKNGKKNTNRIKIKQKSEKNKKRISEAH